MRPQVELRGIGDAGRAHGDAPTDRQQAEGMLAALIFAVHPIHTEAVAGIVGQAELLSAAMSILALLTYIKACLPGCASAPLQFIGVHSPCAVVVLRCVVSMSLCHTIPDMQATLMACTTCTHFRAAGKGHTQASTRAVWA